MKRILLSACSLMLISSCVGTPSPPLSATQSQKNPLVRAQNSSLKQVEQLVSLQRMEKNMATLTGETKFSALSRIPERGTRNGRELTRQFLTQYLESLDYKVERHEYRRYGANIIARLTASEPTDEWIIIGAHMDSVRNAGADDNGSGSTAVLEAATILPQLSGRKVNIMFAWFDEEELGLIGSRYLARRLKNEGLKISSVHTIDMMGWDGDKDKTVELARPDGILWDYYNMVNKTHKLNLPLDRTNTGQSDHVAFHNEGFHSLNLSEEYTSHDSTPHYHRSTDTYNTINFDFLVTGTQLLVAVVGDLSLKVPPPINVQMIPHNQFPSRERHFHNYEDISL